MSGIIRTDVVDDGDLIADRSLFDERQVLCRLFSLFRPLEAGNVLRPPDFQPIAVSQEWLQSDEEDLSAGYVLRLIHDRQLYTAQLRNLGDWYDLERIVDVVNLIVAETGANCRFVHVKHKGQEAALLYGDPEKLEVLAAKLGVQLLIL